MPLTLTRNSLRVLLFLSLISFTASSQYFAVDHYYNLKTLPSNIVFDMVTDPNGFILFSTDNGIVKFDGTEFSPVSYFEEHGNDAILGFYNHRNGMILASTCKNKVICAKPGAKPYVISFKEKGNFCYTKFVYHKEAIFTYYHKLLYKIHLQDDSFFFDPIREVLYKRNFSILSLVSFYNELYFIKAGQLFKVLSDSVKKIYLPENLFDQKIGSLETHNGELILVTKNKIYKTKDFSAFQLVITTDNDSEFEKVFFTRKNEIIYSLKDNGIHYQNLKTGHHKRLLDTDYDVNFIKEDKDGNIWVGTYGDGLFKLSKGFIKNFPVNDGSSQYITDIEVNKEGKLLIGTLKCLMTLDSLKQTVYKLMGERSGHRVDQIKYYDRLKAFLVSSIDPRHYIISFKSNHLADVYYSRSTCNTMVDDIFYFGGYKSYVYKSLLSHRFTRLYFTHVKDYYESGQTIRAYDLINDNGKLLIGTNIGVFSLMLDDEDSEISSRISGKIIRAFRKDRNGKIWAIGDDQIYFFEHDNLMKHQLSSDMDFRFSDMAFHPDSNLTWIATSKGLIVKTPGNELLLDTEFEMISTDITCLKYDPLRNGLWIGTSSEVCFMDIQLFDKQLQKIPRPYFIIGDKPQLENSSVTFEAGTDRMKLDFSALSFVNEKSLKYRYRINGSEWHYTQTNEIDLYLSSPKLYRIELSASNSGLNWSKPIILDAIIEPFFWERKVFYVIISLLILIVIILIVRYRLKQVRKKETDKRRYSEQLNEYKFKAFSASINPHFIFNSLGSLKYMVNNQESQKANSYIGYFSKLLRQNLVDIDKMFIPLNSELERVVNYLKIEQIRFGARLNYEIDVSVELNLSQTIVPGMLIQPFVENSIKHGFRKNGDGYIKIRIEQKGDWLMIVITDDGEGSGHEMKGGTGKGNVLVEERLRVLYKMPGQEFITSYPDFDNGSGYKVEIRIPYRIMDNMEFGKIEESRDNDIKLN